MNLRSAMAAVLSLALAGVLLTVLALRGGVDLAGVAATVSHVRLAGFAVLAGLAAVLVFLSAERWRMIERQAGDHPPPSRLRAFGLTAVGVGFGQILPVQVSTVIGRALGTRLLRPPASRRPIVVTLYEQSFDVAVALLLAVASLIYLVERQIPWLATAGVLLVVGYFAAGWTAVGLDRLCKAGAARGRFGVWLAELSDAQLFARALARRLMLLSVLRFGVTVLMAGLTSWSAGLDVSLGSLAVAVPLVIVATAAPLTPAGLGVNEWTYASTLVLLGAPLALATQWALVNRVLVAAASVAIAVIAVPLLALDSLKSARAKPRDPPEQAPATGTPN
jgi:uncharacterized membrane protein YbhN (UPF0104 family)